MEGRVPGSERGDEEPTISKPLSMRGADPPLERTGYGPGSHLVSQVRWGKRRKEGSYRHLVPILTLDGIKVSEAQYPTGICPLTSYARIPSPTTSVLLHSPLLLDLDQPLPEPECDPINLPGPCCLMMGLSGGVDRHSRSGSRWDVQPEVACPDPSSSWMRWAGSE